MYLFTPLLERVEHDNPVRVGLIGAGKFGTMFLAQVPTTPALQITVIADLDPGAAMENCRRAGWSAERIAATRFTDDAAALIAAGDVDVVVEATGVPEAGIAHALQCCEHGKHVVMVNVEADVVAGPHLAATAASAGIVYSMAYGDQPALTVEMVEWARACGFEVVAAGKGTKYLPAYHASTPDTIWDHYGLNAREAAAAGMKSQMFNSFLDGTKSAIEMAAIANATGLAPPEDGLRFPPCSVDDLASVLRPAAQGGVLDRPGQVEVVSCLHRDGSEVSRDLRWGVFCIFEAPNDYSADCFRQYGMNTDDSGRYSAMYKPFHLIGLELNISILAAALGHRATGASRRFTADVVAVAKRNLTRGETLDGEGGYTVWGRLTSARQSVATGALPIGLASGVALVRDIPEGAVIGLADIASPGNSTGWRARNRMVETASW